MSIHPIRIAAGAAIAIAATSPQAADLQSISRLSFGPANTLFVADWKAARVHALTLPPASAPTNTTGAATFNILDLEALVTRTLGVAKVSVEDMAVRPGTGEVWLAVSHGAGKTPALLVVTSDRKARRIDLARAKSDSVTLNDATRSDYKFWKNIPQRSFTVTDMKWRDGELFVAGLSNKDFAATLRRIPYPFGDRRSMSSIEIYHATHHQIETRAPIRAMTFADLGGKPYLVAAYTCTPLVTIPLEELKDGAHVRGKTIAELGYGNTPAELVTFSKAGADGKREDNVLLINYERVANVIPVAQIEAANAKPALDQPVPFGHIVGVEAAQVPLAGAVRVDNLNDQFFVMVRRQLEKGTLELVTVDKNMAFRLSDFVSEYNFPQYSYKGKEFQLKYLKPVQDMLMKQEGYPDLIPSVE